MAFLKNVGNSLHEIWLEVGLTAKLITTFISAGTFQNIFGIIEQISLVL